MILLEDTRQQLDKHNIKKDVFTKLGIEVQRSKLFVGDYTLANDNSIAIDTKKDMLEIFGNLTFQHDRFREECIKAQKGNIKLIILVEEELPSGGIVNWVSPVYKSTSGKHTKGEPMTKYSPVTAKKVMLKMMEKYGVQFVFCSPEKSPYVILNLLGIKGE